MLYLTEASLPLKSGCVLTIGNFDGVHLGHQALIAKTTELAKAAALPSAVWTFESHPQSFLSRESVKYVIGAGDKAALMEESGADLYYAADFAAFRGISAADFVRDELIGRFNVKHAVCGRDFSFGFKGEGKPDTLKSLLAAFGADCTVLPPVLADGLPASSTRLRALIAAGDMEAAARLLGRLYSFNLPVSRGRRMGRALGSPTVNQLFPEDRALPAFGVYAVFCEAVGRLWKGVANIGVRPTVGETDGRPVCETHIFDFSGDLYGRDVKVMLYKKLRDERKFPSLADLAAQIALDVRKAGEVLNINS